LTRTRSAKQLGEPVLRFKEATATRSNGANQVAAESGLIDLSSGVVIETHSLKVRWAAKPDVAAAGRNASSEYNRALGEDVYGGGESECCQN